MSEKRLLVRFPWIILVAALMLTAIGLLAIYSATAGSADKDEAADAVKQVQWLAVSLCVFVLVVWPSYTRLSRYSYLLFAVALVLLGLLIVARLVPGGQGIHNLVEQRNFAFRWLQIPGTKIAVQPSEIAKIAFIMALARYLTRRKKYRQLKGLALPFLMALAPMVMVVVQPDLGTALLFMPVLFMMLLAAGAKMRHILVVVLAGVLLAPLFYLKIDTFQQRRVDQWLLAGPLEDFHVAEQKAAMTHDELTPAEKHTLVERLQGSLRVQAFLAADQAKWWTGRRLPWLFGSKKVRESGDYDQPYSNALAASSEEAEAAERPPAAGTADTPEKQYERAHQFVRDWLKGSGYHSWQAKVAVGAGGLTGAGLGQGSQIQHGFVAEAQNDFLFAVVAEEWGFVGTMIVLGLYLVIIVFGIDVGLSTNEPYGKLLAVGVVAMFSAQAFINMAVTVGLTPVTGIPLPLMSYGGSSLVSSYVAIGLLCSVGLRRYRLPEPGPFQFDDE
jgi:rod shape determining protein RodA